MSQIEIFKAGKQTSSSGRVVELTVDDLQKIADNYNEKVAEGGDTYKAPLVIGHPTAEAPAYGWAASLSVDRAAGLLLATTERVDEGLKGLVAEGKYTRVSASLYTPDSPHSPVKDGFFLRHIGFLGAMAPAVKGLKAVSFSDADAGVLSFGDDEAKAATVLQRLVSFVAKQFGKDQADAILFGEPTAPVAEPAAEPVVKAPAVEVPAVEAPAAAAVVADTPAADAPATETPAVETPAVEASAAAEPVVAAVVAEPAAEPAVVAVETPVVQEAALVAEPAAAVPATDFAEREAAFAAREAELAQREAAARDAEIESFAESLITAGRVLPVSKSAVTTLFKTLGQVGSVDFAEGEQKPAAELFKDLLNSLPKVVEFKEIASEETGPAPSQYADFAVAPGYSVSAKDLDTLAKAKAIQAANPGLSITQAYSRI